MKYLITIILALAAVNSEAQLTDSLSGRLLRQEKLYWLASNDSVKYCVLLTKAKLNREAGLYVNALSELNRAEDISVGNSEVSEIEYEKMITYFLLGRYDGCVGIAIDSGQIAGHYHEYLLMKLYSLDETEKWTECKNLLLQNCSKRDTLKINEVENLPISYKHKSPQKAKVLSSILPGLGETYAGYPLKGFTSLLLNGGFLFFAGYNFYTAYYISGSVLGVFPFLRFYSGGKRLSFNLANQHNQKISDRIKKKYWEEIDAVVH